MKSDKNRIEEIKDLNVNELKAECRAEKLPTTGDKQTLAKRVKVNKMGSATKFTGGGMVKCKICNMPAGVRKVIRKKMDDGRIMVTRQIRCTGRHGHTYPLSEIVKADN